jgi:hypothetical protein
MPSSLLFSALSCRNNDECTAGLFCSGVQTYWDTTPLSRTIGVAIRHYRAEERSIRTDA